MNTNHEQTLIDRLKNLNVTSKVTRVNDSSLVLKYRGYRNTRKVQELIEGLFNLKCMYHYYQLSSGTTFIYIKE